MGFKGAYLCTIIKLHYHINELTQSTDPSEEYSMIQRHGGEGTNYIRTYRSWKLRIYRTREHYYNETIVSYGKIV